MTDTDLVIPRGKSRLAVEVQRLPGSARTALRVTSEAIAIWDGLVSFFALMTDDADGRPWQERMKSTLDSLSALTVGTANRSDDEALQKWTSEFQRAISEDLTNRSSEFRREGYQRFLLRLLGAKAYRECLHALQHDTAIVTVALRRAMRAALPYLAALDNMYNVLPSDATRKMTSGGSPVVLLELAFKLDEMFGDKVLEWSLPLATIGARDVELASLSDTDISSVAEQLRTVISGRARESVEKLDERLARKINGARHALQNSPDPATQAANSLIELLDRILRSAFDEDEVLLWVRKNYPDAVDTEFIDANRANAVRPTKKAQALCLVHGGADVNEPSAMHELAAMAVAAVRSGLQKIKHADRGGTPEELAAIEVYLSAIEGYLLFAIELAWAAAPEDRVERFHANLG